MCGRYAFTLPPEAMRDLFRTLNSIDYPPRYNIAPTQPIVTVLNERGRREARLARWGLVPEWVKDPREFPLIINARVEGLTGKPAFRGAMRHHRCIVPASGYYEWKKEPGGAKTPYYITRVDGGPMAFAGLFSTWLGPSGEEVDTAAIVTVPSGPDTADIHDRMPAVLSDDDIDFWLDNTPGSAGNAEAARQLALPLPMGSLAMHAVSQRVNSNRNEGPDLIEPATESRPEPKRKAAGGGGSGQMDLF
ncbi:MAG TPA: SOS response-associated peptidase [Devosiaceae bacterium]